jgi:predicted MPP superfamily phosphohydrolase
MSHDPSQNMKKITKNFHLTLSGHTHGMQFGIETQVILSGAWLSMFMHNGLVLYENLGRYIYVNRGFGFHAYPGSGDNARNHSYRTKKKGIK